MKAIVITSPGAPDVLEFVDRPKPVPAKNEVLINVKAAGVNRPILRSGREVIRRRPVRLQIFRD